MKKMTMLSALAATVVIVACGKSEGDTHNLTADESRRAQINAEAYFNQEHPAGQDAAGNLVKKKGSFVSCRPQDSNSNDLVTCVGMRPNMQGAFTQATMYCGYNAGAKAIIGCSDKDQK